jgi:hypothetical protein
MSKQEQAALGAGDDEKRSIIQGRNTAKESKANSFWLSTHRVAAQMFTVLLVRYL